MTLERIMLACRELRTKIPYDLAEFVPALQRWQNEAGESLKRTDPIKYQALFADFSAIGNSFSQGNGALIQELVYLATNAVFERKRETWGGNLGAAFNDTRDEIQELQLSERLFHVTLQRLNDECVTPKSHPIPVSVSQSPTRKSLLIPATAALATKMITGSGTAVAKAVSKRPVVSAGVAAGLVMGFITLNEISARIDDTAGQRAVKTQSSKKSFAQTVSERNRERNGLDSLLDAGDQLHKLGDNQGAYWNYTKVLDSDPTPRQNRKALGSLAVLYKDAGDYKSAQFFITKILTADPGNDWALRMRESINELPQRQP